MILKNVNKMFLFFYGLTLVMFVNDVNYTFIETIFSLILLLLFFIDNILIQKKFKIPKIFNLLFLFIFFALLGLALNNVWQYEYFDPIITLFKIFIFLIVLYNIISNDNDSVKFLINGILLGVIINISIGYFVGRDFFGQLGYRYAGSLQNPNHYSFILCSSIIFLIFYYTDGLFNTIFKKIIALIFLYIIIFEIIFFSGSRIGIITLIFIAFYFLLMNFKINIRNISYLILFSVVLTTVVFLSIEFFPKSINRVLSLTEISEFNSSNISDPSFMYRFSYIIKGIEYWTENPIIGLGIDQFRHVNNSSYSHNNYVELLSTTGIIGFLLYYIFIAKLFFKKNVNSVKFHWSQIAIITLLISDLTSVSYLEKPYWIVLIILIVVNYSKHSNRNYNFKL
tara:strand:+ start:219 stop:1406 length:1188 start_codon:yes stop_codon:yes gene_type:complete